jgi:DNA ligase-1
MLSIEEWYAAKPWTPFRDRVREYTDWREKWDADKQFLKSVVQYECKDADAVLSLQRDAQLNGGEGLMLKCPNSVYRHSRSTVKQNEFFKLKFWDTINGKIVDFKQKQRLTEEARENNTEKSALGRTKRGHRQDDREAVDDIGSVEIEITEGQVFPKGTRFFAMWSKEAPEIRAAMTWDNRAEFIGKHVEIEYQSHGSKDKPRLPRIVRWRRDLD